MSPAASFSNRNDLLMVRSSSAMLSGVTPANASMLSAIAVTRRSRGVSPSLAMSAAEIRIAPAKS